MTTDQAHEIGGQFAPAAARVIAEILQTSDLPKDLLSATFYLFPPPSTSGTRGLNFNPQSEAPFL